MSVLSTLNQASFQSQTVMAAASVAVDATAKTYTRATGSFLTDGFMLGKTATWSGFTNAGNNITVTPTTLTATVMTCSGATGLVTEASAAGRSCLSDCGIQDWTGRIETLLTGNWIKTADAGQTAASAMPSSTAINQLRGFQIWKMNDTLAATYPVFMKLEYWSDSNVAYPRIYITIGTGSDGNGNLTGIIMPRSTGPASVGLVGTHFMGSCAPNRFLFSIGISLHYIFCIERTKDAAGADTSDGVYVLFEGNSNTASLITYNRLCRFSGASGASSTLLGAIAPSGSTWGLGGTIGTSPIRFFDGQPTNPCISAQVYMQADITAFSTAIPISIYGVTRNYYSLGTSVVATAASGASTSTFLLLYE